jgi:hypothetical protein
MFNFIQTDLSHCAYADAAEELMQLTQFAVNDGPHNSDGLLLHGWDGPQHVTAFISRRVMDNWIDPRQPIEVGKVFFASSTTRSVSETWR